MSKYIDHDYYLMNKKFPSLLLKYKIYINNKKYITNMINEEFIINNISLDKEQKKALFTEEMNTLVLASAGSGKTLTICAKVELLISNGIKHTKYSVFCVPNE